MRTSTIFDSVLVAKKISVGGSSWVTEVTKDAPVGWWRMGEITDTPALDFSDEIGTNDLTTNGTITYEVAGATTDGDTAVTLDGSTAYADVASNFGITAYPLTLACFVKANDVSDFGNAIFLGSSTSEVDYLAIGLDDLGRAYINARTDSGGNEITYSSGTYDDDTWYFLVGVFRSATDRELYVDGVSVATDTTSVAFPDGVNNLTVGRFGDSSPGIYFNGTIDEVAIYNKELTAARQLIQISNK